MKYKYKPNLILNCECAGKKYCDRLRIIDFDKYQVEINVEKLVKGKRKLVGGVVVQKIDLLKYIK